MKYGKVELHNVCEIRREENGNGFQILRLPQSVCENINTGARNNAVMGAGCEIRGMLAPGGEARVSLQVLDDNTTPPVATVYHGCFCGQSVVLGREPSEIVVAAPQNLALLKRVSQARKLPFDAGLVRIRFPQIHPVRILSIDGDWSFPSASATPSKTMLCYGSSITHGACAIPPEGTYVSQCAQYLGVDSINLGFGGSAHMDSAIADHIAARDDWDVATFEMGINVRNWPLEKFHAVVESFVGTVAAAHPDKFIFCIDLFTYHQDFEAAPTMAVGFRDAVDEIADKCNSRKVIHVDGRRLLTNPGGLRTDLVHPSDIGMQEMGRNLAGVIAERCNLDKV